MSIRIKLLINFIILVLISLSISGILGYFFTRELIEKDYILKEFERISFDLTHSLEKEFEERKNDMRSFNILPEIEALFFNQMLNDQAAIDENKHLIENYFLDFQKKSPYYEQIQLIDTFGNVQIRVVEGKIFKGVISREEDDYFKACLKLDRDQVYISKIYITKDNKEIIRFGVALFDALGRKRSVLIADFDFTRIRKIISRIKVGKEGYGFIFNKEGLVLASSSDILGIRKNFFAFANISEKGKKEILEASTSNLKYRIKGKQFIAFFNQYPRRTWISGITIPVFEYEKDLSKLKYLSIVILLFTLGLATISAYWNSNYITRPLMKIKDTVAKIGRGNLDLKIEYESNDEIGILTKAFNKMSVDLKKYINELQETTKIKERLKKELDIAADIQKSVLPTEPPSIKGFDVAAAFVPCYECGGDFFDYFPIDIRNTSFVISDTSGKGLPAALFALQSKSYLQACFESIKQPLKVIEKLNTFLSNTAQTKFMFLTLFLGILNHKEKSFEYVSAGHNLPIVVKGDGNHFFLDKSGNTVLGVDESVTFTEKAQIHFEKEDVLVLYTDGITEAVDKEGDQFGEERLIETIKEFRNLSAQEITDKIIQRVRDHAGVLSQFDDMTLVVIKNYA